MGREMYFVCWNHDCRKTHSTENFNEHDRDVKCECGGTVISGKGEVTISFNPIACKTIPVKEERPLILEKYIEMKRSELLETNREVEFSSATDVGLSKFSVSEMFTAAPTDMDKIVEEVDLSKIDITETFPLHENGSKVVFNVKPPWKRKFVTKEFYVLWK